MNIRRRKRSRCDRVRVRIFTLNPGPSCDVWFDTNLADQLKFAGKEHFTIKSGLATGTLSFSGVQTLPGNNLSDSVSGAASSLLKCSGPKSSSEKGSISCRTIAFAALATRQGA